MTVRNFCWKECDDGAIYENRKGYYTSRCEVQASITVKVSRHQPDRAAPTRRSTTPQRVVFRVQLLLGSAESFSNNKLAAQLNTTRSTVIKWRDRYQEGGLESILEDAPRSGRKKTISADKERAIVKATLETCEASRLPTCSLDRVGDLR